MQMVHAMSPRLLLVSSVFTEYHKYLMCAGCQESCVDAKYHCGENLVCESCGDIFQCVDPRIATPAPTETLYNRTCIIEEIGDGICNTVNNNDLCSYDGGDCCAPSCQGSSCGRLYPYNCTDPETPDFGVDCRMDYVADGECDPVTNVQACHYDGGDCCPETCVDSTYACSPYDCIDPGTSFFNSTTTLGTSVYQYIFCSACALYLLSNAYSIIVS